jgi:hypothetical protein
MTHCRHAALIFAVMRVTRPEGAMNATVQVHRILSGHGVI